MTSSTRPLMLVLAALLAATGLLGGTQAEPIDEPPIVEDLVEGHVVFATIDAYHRDLGPAPQRAPAPEALLPLPIPAPASEEVLLYIERNPGVLWFNDQFLVEPDVSTMNGLGAGVNMSSTYGAAVAVLVRADEDDGVREPCGGAVMAWPAGYGDARQLFTLLPPEAAPAEAYLPGEVLSDPYYWESYRVTDPNGRTFVTDVYLTTVYSPWGEPVLFPISVTNLHGGETFVPDIETPRVGGTTTGDCAFLDVRPQGVDPLTPSPLDAHEVTCGLPPPLGLPHFLDDPCMGYMEPARNGFCFAGPISDEGGACEHSAQRPLRRYQAVMYFAWEFLPPIGVADHCNAWTWPSDPGDLSLACEPANSLATNGCQTGTEWPCPYEEPWSHENGYDSFEGDSHPFAPWAPPHATSNACPRAGDPNPVDHGGSPNATWGPCDYFHAMAQIEVAYVGASRPPTPAVRFFRVDDASASDAPFFDHACAYEGICS